MKCSYCGKNNRQGALVCKRCGIALPPSPPPAEARRDADGEADPKPLRARRHASIGLIAVLAAAAAIAALIFVLASNGGVTLPGRNSYSVCSNAVFHNGETVVPEDSAILSAETSVDGRRAAIHTEDNSLFTAYRGETSLVARSVSCYALSSDGKAVAFLDLNSLLWLCDCTGRELTPICICNDYVDTAFAISPDGKTLLFNKQGDPKLYLYSRSRIKAIGDGLVPVSVSDGGSRIYAYSPSENALYYLTKKGKATFLRSNIGSDIFLNRKHNEIVFSTIAGDNIVITMVCADGGEPAEIRNAAAAVSPVIPVSGIVMRDQFAAFSISTCPFRSFDKKLFAGDGLVRYIPGKGSVVISASICTAAAATDDYGTVFCLEDGGLSRMIVRNKGASSVIADDCVSFRISANGSAVWYTDGAGALHYRKGGKDAVIAGDVSDYVVSSSGREAVFIAGDLLCSNRGGNPKQTLLYGKAASDLFSDANGFYVFNEVEGWTKLPESTGKKDISGRE
ncbi:MAG: PD40 domain-containing protein [Clostridia bacterium]|nr:PD40 domain-containing protein [Clostridia bacterium]